MLNQFNSTKNKIVDYVTAQERMKILKNFKRAQKNQDTYNEIKLYIQRKQGKF